MSDLTPSEERDLPVTELLKRLLTTEKGLSSSEAAKRLQQYGPNDIVEKKRKVAKAYADTAYDARKNFNALDDLSIEPAIRLRKNARTRSHGSPLRREEAVLVKRLGYEGWKSLKDYGKRWLVEMVFSSFKRVLGDTLRSRKFLNQKAEASLKVMLYNRFLSIRP